MSLSSAPSSSASNALQTDASSDSLPHWGQTSATAPPSSFSSATTPIRSFDALFAHLAQRSTRCRVAVAQPSDAHTLEAVLAAVKLGFVEAFLVGDCHEPTLATLPEGLKAWVHRVGAADAAEAMQRAVQMVHDDEADVLMKGLVNTDDLLRHVLNKSYGLRREGAVMSHVAAFRLPQLERIVLLSDVAVIPAPTPEQRRAQLCYTAEIARQLGIGIPRVALLHFTEKVSEKFPVTLDYVALREEVEQHQAGMAYQPWGDILIDGPLDFLCALSQEGLADKHLTSVLEGKADILLFPDMEAGNAVYKTLGFLVPGAEAASMLVGTSHPVVLTSRGDTIRTKINSLALAALAAY